MPCPPPAARAPLLHLVLMTRRRGRVSPCMHQPYSIITGVAAAALLTAGLQQAPALTINLGRGSESSAHHARDYRRERAPRRHYEHERERDSSSLERDIRRVIHRRSDSRPEPPPPGPRRR